CEQQPQALRKANQDKTDSYCLDRQYVLPQAEFTDHQNVKTPEPKSDHRDAADTDHIGKDLSHGQLLRLPTDSQGNRRRARNSRQHENGSMKILYAFDLIELNGDDCGATRLRSARPRSHLSWPRPAPVSGSTSISRATARPSLSMPAKWASKASCRS